MRYLYDPFMTLTLAGDKNVRIHNGRAYVVARHAGLSGFQRWEDIEHTVVNAGRARQDRSYVVAEFSGDYFPAGTEYFAQNGRAPEYQPQVLSADVAAAAQSFNMGIRVVKP